jgi:hypothetical protein
MRKSLLATKIIYALIMILFCSYGTARAQSIEEMASPISNPINFEDPRIFNEVRPIYMYHSIDRDFVTNGGNISIVALQLRYAVSERFSLVLNKSGYVFSRPASQWEDDSGFANLGGGFKYNFFKDTNDEVLGTAGLKFEAPTGNRDVYQGRGYGILNPFISGSAVWRSLNFMAGTGLRIPMNDNDSLLYDLDLHVDTNMGWIKPVAEISLINVWSDGKRIPIHDEGQDFFNFGASLADEKTIVTGSVGARIPLTNSSKNPTSFGAAYQLPWAQGRGTDFTDWRVITDLSFKF